MGNFSKSLAFAAGLALLASVPACARQNAVAATPSTRPATRPAVIVAEPYVLVVSIDGGRPDCILRADAPNLRGLMARGSYTFWAHTTEIAVTLPSHVSMLSGVTPERHGVSFNDDPPAGAVIAVPTIFDLAHAARLSTGLASGKRKFTLFTRTDHVDFATITDKSVCDDAFVGDAAARIVAGHLPRLMVVHFPGADTVGHAVGWGTPEQIAVLGDIDVQLGKVLRAYDDAGLRDRMYVIVSSDHGGSARVHGKDDERSRFIPWVMAGPGVRANYDLTRLGKAYDVATFDTFATACLILGLPADSGVDGRPVTQAFEGIDLLDAAATTRPAK